MKDFKVNVKDILIDAFQEGNYTDEESRNTNREACVLHKNLREKLPQELKKEFDAYVNAQSLFEYNYFNDFVEFVLNFLKEI